MKRVRALICLVFVISFALFVAYNVKLKMVEDTKPPVISCDQDEITVSVKDDESALLEGITAEDNRDGDLTDSVRVSSISHFINGKRTVRYAVFDNSNQVGTYERTMEYLDYTSPKIYLKKALRFSSANTDKLAMEEYYLAEDCLDGNITGQVRTIVENDFYGMEEGIFPITLQVSNSAGDVCSVPVDLQIVNSGDDDEREKEYPLLSDYIVYVKEGNTFTPSKFLIGVSRGTTDYKFGEGMTGASKDDITIKSNVDYDTPGVYTVEFSYKAAGAPKAVTKMYVVVEEK